MIDGLDQEPARLIQLDRALDDRRVTVDIGRQG